MVLVGVLVYLLRRHMLDRGTAAAKPREQRKCFRTTLASIADAVIATDTEGRVTFLNSVAERLTGWKESEALGASLGSVVKIIDEETRQAAENPATRALHQGVAVGMANHTLLLS